MFQSKKYIEQRHGKESANREDHLKLLVQEYQVTQSQEAKQQILANLANFAYDPINYNTLWDLQVIQLFLDALEEHDGLLQEFGIGGIANICLEQRHHQYLLSQPSFRHSMVGCLKATCTLNTQMNAMTALMQLVTPDNYTILLTSELKDHLKRIQTGPFKQANKMATLFLVDYFHC